MDKLVKLLRPHIFCKNFSVKFSDSVIDWDYYSNPENFSCIADNVTSRKVHCDLVDVLTKLNELNQCRNDNPEKLNNLREKLLPSLLWFPNSIHPRVLKNKSEEPNILKKVGPRPHFEYFPTNFEHLTKRLNVLRTKHLGHICGHKSYFLKGDLSVLEHALVRYSVSKLMKKKFEFLYVPDILPKDCIERCGMKTSNTHSQVYHVDSWAKDMCLSGTSEIAVASFLSSRIFDYKSLPMKFCAVSRCYRAEANKHQKERGIFRVHQFTKVEMFGITANETGNESEKLLDEFTKIQEEIFSELGLYFRILELPPSDLGLPAYHKYDMEAWIPTQKLFGEISSASNCTDYQSRRLSIKYLSPSNEHKFCHTVNGTAAAIPRLLISILENFQNLDGSITIPEPLREYFKKDKMEDKLPETMLCTKITK